MRKTSRKNDFLYIIGPLCPYVSESYTVQRFRDELFDLPTQSRRLIDGNAFSPPRTLDSVFANIKTHPEAETIPGLLIFRFDEQLFFANASNFRADVRLAVGADPSVRVVLIDAEAVNDIDVTAIDMLGELKDELASEQIALRFARMRSSVKETLYRAGMDEKVGVDHFYPSVEGGVQAFLAEESQAQAQDADEIGKTDVSPVDVESATDQFGPEEPPE